MSIPVTILGGFLGAGKTTALNHLLRHAEGRLGVLVNDFGAINVDAALIEAQEGDLVALSNGCICCAVGPDLGQSLGRLLERRPARIVVEASGVSDPWRVAQLAKLEAGVALEAVAVLVDAINFPEQLADPWLADTLARQLARADLIGLSKCDLASPAQRSATTDAVRRLRPDARVLTLMQGVLPEFLLSSGLLRDPGRTERLAAEMAPGFRAWHCRPLAPFDRDRLGAVLDGLPSSVLRAKGFCRLGPAGEPHLLQLVGRRWSLTPWPGGDADGLVVIGTEELPAAEMLQRAFSGARLHQAC